MNPKRTAGQILTGKFSILLAYILIECAVGAASEPRPNILLFIADNWSWPHAGVLGDPTAKTPAFDRVAREGMLFTNTFCPVPSCSPTRSCILTGRPAHQLRDAASLWSAFPGDLKVFTQDLREAGYEVGCSGKGWAPGNHLDFGWDENPVGRQYRSLEEFLERRDAAKPFFFWIGNTDTSLNKWRHEPEGWTGLDPNSVAVPPMLPDHAEVRTSMLGYYGSVGRVDLDAANALARLEQSRLLGSAVFFFTSDNGWQMPRGLANCYDTGTRVPLAVRWEGGVAAGSRSDEFIDLTDLAPTILELAGLPVPAAMTGRSFADILSGSKILAEQSNRVVRDCVFVERERHANVRVGNLSYPIRGIRTAEFLYLRNFRPERWPAGDPKMWFAVGDFGDVDNSRAKLFMIEHRDDPAVKPVFDLCFAKRPAEELYDLKSDPHQLRNVAADPTFATPLTELRRRVDLRMSDTSDPRLDPNYDEWDRYKYFGNPPRSISPGTGPRKAVP